MAMENKLNTQERNEETYYDILKVNRTATISEIVAAYHTTKNAFSKESVATYSLFNPEETQAILDKLDEAYRTLSNIEKKQEYDQFLELRSQDADFPAMSELEIKKKAGLQKKVVEKQEAEIEYTPLISDYTGRVTGAQLREIRDKKGISISELARITKIPARYIESIEKDEVDKLPARVYVHGFVKNLAALYNIDSTLATKSYLDHIDRNNEDTEE